MAQNRSRALSKKMQTLSEKLAAVDTIKDPKQQGILTTRYMKQMADEVSQRTDEISQMTKDALREARASQARVAKISWHRMCCENP
jgi:hypothetical protein